MRARGVAGIKSRIGSVSTTADYDRMVVLRRARGLLLRFVRRRVLATVVGLALVVPSAWVEFSAWADAWWMEGLALVVGATGLALTWTGIVGVAPDWTED
jgi:hypothetical protein